MAETPGARLAQLDDETLQYMHSTPFFNLEQQRRCEYLKQVGSEISTIANHFTLYADIGQKMCSEFQNLRKSFDNMEFICTDASIKPLCEIFQAVDIAFTQHFRIVGDKIVRPLNDFVAKELEKLTVLEKEYQKNMLGFNAAEEKYVMIKPQAKESTRQEREQTLVQTHTCSTLAFFEFCMKMESMELKLKSILPQMFMSYLTSVSIPFTDCLAAMNDKGDELNTTQNTIQEVNQQVQDFSNHSVQIKQRVSSQIPVFWQRFTAPFVGTSSTSIQGYLWKKRKGSLSKSWHKRFFMVSNGVLSWAKTVDEALRSQKNVSLMLCSVKPEPSMPRNNCFSISNNKSGMILQALTKWDMNSWLAVIQNSIMQKINANPEEQQEGPMLTASVTTVCADCGAPNASWCSINWGVTLCESCCAEHRSLGATYSKVRSLQLDAVDSMQRALVEAIGTDRANEVLEANVGDRKIDQQSPNMARKRFIQLKYQSHAFAASADDIDIFQAIQNQELMTVYRYVASGNLTDLSGFTPIHAAACVGNPLILHLLCLNSNSIDVVDEGGWTPVCYAVYNELPAMLDILTLYGADLRIEGVNPYDIAKSKNNEHLMTKLAAVMDTSTFSEDKEYKPAHEEIHPMGFVFSDYVEDPSIYLTVKFEQKGSMTAKNKKKLDSAISALRHRLSMQNSHQKQLISDTDESDDKFIDPK